MNLKFQGWILLLSWNIEGKLVILIPEEATLVELSHQNYVPMDRTD